MVRPRIDPRSLHPPVSLTPIVSILIAVALLMLSAKTYADDSNTVVLIAPKEQSSKFDGLVEQMASQFDETGVHFEVHWIEKLPDSLPAQESLGAKISKQHQALAVFWCDLSVAESVYFYVSTADTGKLLVRRLDGVGPEGVNDALSMISLTAVEGLIRGGAIGIEGPQDSDDETAQKKHKILVSAQAAYTLSIISEELGISQGAWVGMGLFPREWFGFELGYGVYAPMVDKNSMAELSLQRHPMLLGVRGQAHRGIWSLGVSLAFVIDYLTKTPRALASNVILDEPYSSFHFSILPSLRGELRIASVLGLFLSAGFEFHINRVEYLVTGSPTLWKDPWRFQPTAMAGLAGYFSTD